VERRRVLERGREREAEKGRRGEGERGEGRVRGRALPAFSFVPTTFSLLLPFLILIESPLSLLPPLLKSLYHPVTCEPIPHHIIRVLRETVESVYRTRALSFFLHPMVFLSCK